jgi:hypothetical protein
LFALKIVIKLNSDFIYLFVTVNLIATLCFGNGFFSTIIQIIKMVKNNYARYFRVFKNDTVVTEISTNDFRRLKLRPVKENWLIGDTTEVLGTIAGRLYTLPVNSPLFYGYATRSKAMEMAKAGALNYIDKLIDEGASGEETLLQYRRDHYEDLRINLVYDRIENEKRAEKGEAEIIIPQYVPLWF